MESYRLSCNIWYICLMSFVNEPKNVSSKLITHANDKKLRRDTSGMKKENKNILCRKYGLKKKMGFGTTINKLPHCIKHKDAI